MSSALPLGHGQGQHINRPALFNGQYYSWWKTKMEDFIQAEDYELWVRIIDGPLTPTVKDSEGNNVPKPKEQYGEADYKMLGKNALAKCILVCGLGPDECNRISSCTSAKQIWDTLQNAHESTTQVRKFRIARLSSEYEAFEMKSGESLQDMITRFTTVVNELISLGKIYTTEEQVDKVLRTLPRSWEIKVTAIREAKDLTNMTLDELEGNLKTYEMNVDKRSEGNKEKKLDSKQLKVMNQI
ncbi:hypothetical protein KY289_016230 [Solanum tuberosum]|nr:hypothetical protein KY289_016230 [Solanum tuberosum]